MSWNTAIYHVVVGGTAITTSGSLPALYPDETFPLAGPNAAWLTERGLVVDGGPPAYDADVYTTTATTPYLDGTVPRSIGTRSMTAQEKGAALDAAVAKRRGAVNAQLVAELNSGVTLTFPDGTADTVQTRPNTLDLVNLVSLWCGDKDLVDSGTTTTTDTLRTAANVDRVCTVAQRKAIIEAVRDVTKARIRKASSLKDAIGTQTLPSEATAYPITGTAADWPNGTTTWSA